MAIVVVFRISDPQQAKPLPFVRILDSLAAGYREDLIQVITEDGEQRVLNPTQLLRQQLNSNVCELIFEERETDELTESQQQKAELLSAVLPPVRFINQMNSVRKAANTIVDASADWLGILRQLQEEYENSPAPKNERHCALKVIRQPLYYDFKIDFRCADKVCNSETPLALCVLMTTRKYIIPRDSLIRIVESDPLLRNAFASRLDFWSEEVPDWAHGHQWYV